MSEIDHRRLEPSDLDTGEQLVTLSDFFKHGFVICLLSFAVLWDWAIFGYWRWMGF